MELCEAVRKLVPLQIRLPDRRRPLTLIVRGVAELFIAETTQGPAVIWLETFWCKSQPSGRCYIAYAAPRPDQLIERWVDHNPRYGPHCLGYQRPVVIERITRDSPAWREHQAWQAWRARLGASCDRSAAWQTVLRQFGDLIKERVT